MDKKFLEKNDKIYVAGNTGLVGSAIVRYLKSKGYRNLVFTPFPEYDLRDQFQVNEFFQLPVLSDGLYLNRRGHRFGQSFRDTSPEHRGQQIAEHSVFIKAAGGNQFTLIDHHV